MHKGMRPFLLCSSDADWLSRQTLITWLGMDYWQTNDKKKLKLKRKQHAINIRLGERESVLKMASCRFDRH